MNKPKRIDISQKELDALIERVESGNLLDSDREIIKAMAETISILSHAVDEKTASIRRLLKMIFGSSTEKTSKVVKNKGKESVSHEKPGSKDKPKPKGHGRNGAESYSGADKVEIQHDTLKPKDKCPKCLKGKLYEMKTPKTVVRVTGQSPLYATVFEMQKLRCNLCGEIFTANEPDGIGEEKYDAESGAMIALLKYGSGLPFNRLEQLQASLGVPLPASTQWDIVESVADTIHPVFSEFQFLAAQGEVVYNDDTIMKILELMKQNKESPPRKGMFSSGIISTTGDRKIALFFTGRKHAGENLRDLLDKRKPGMKPPIQMCDALARNFSGDFNTLLANCLAHGRRNFVDIAWNFPEECAHVFEELKKVYKNDALAKEQNLAPDQRLAFHQKNSKPVMDELKEWFRSQIDDKKVEPNSSLGKAIKYMQNHWNELTLFLREPGAPLDNNLCERALKKAILHRKNSLFYKTQHGAYVGDLFMSLIHTCNLCEENPFHYLTALQKNSSLLFKDPGKWMPWNYKEAIQTAG